MAKVELKDCRMILFHAPRSPFSRTARIVIHELALERAVEMRIIDPWTDESLRAANPLCKVPTLQRNDGTTLYDSRVICEYLNEFAGGPLLARSGPERWDALRRQALGNGLAEAVIRRHVETLDAPGERRDSVVRRQDAAIVAALEELEREGARTPGRGFDLGDVAVVVALGYFQFRSPDLAQTHLRPLLRSWLASLERRPSCIATRIAALPPG